nr:hypothetical protein [Tanacetum cinerariifolium]
DEEIVKIHAKEELQQMIEGLDRNTNEPHHTPSLEAQPSSHTHISSPTLPTVTTFPTVTSSETTPLRQYTQRARISQSSALPPIADEPASPMTDVSQGEACPTDSGFVADQDRANKAKTSTLPHESTSRATVQIGLKICNSSIRDHRIKSKSQVLEGQTMRSRVVPTASTTISTATPIFTTATTVTPYTRRKGKEKMVETHTPKKKKRLQEQIDI